MSSETTGQASVRAVSLGEVGPASDRVRAVDGVRGVALLLVVGFHLFANGRVSGGIDIFLALTGFLFTLVFIRRASHLDGGPSLVVHYARLLRRLLPAALVVITATVIASYFIPTQNSRSQILFEGAASAHYYQNWQLINTQLEYEAAGPGSSLFQHYWSLSVQGQGTAAQFGGRLT